MNARIVSLHSYPLKSARACDHAEATLGERGFLHDREWLVIDARGRFMTQRELPSLARLVVTVGADTLRLQHADAAFALPHVAAGAAREVRIWGSDCLGSDCGDAVAAWLSACLQQPVRLLRFDPARPRASNPAYTGDIVAHNAFSDGYPLLVANVASLQELNTRLAKPLPMNRFRPNIVLEGLEPWAEDRIAKLTVRGVRLRLVKPSVRCIITTTDQATGERMGEEPLRTLRAYRHNAELGGVCFAENAIIVSGVGSELRVGDELAVGWER